MARFELAIDRLLDREQGYVNDPDDRGKETNLGISARSYPDENIKAMTRRRASDIYRRDYWDEMRCGQMYAQTVAEAVFDFGVNAGIGQASKLIQACVRVTTDGIIGPVTINAINDVNDDGFLLIDYSLRRCKYYALIASRRSSQKKFLAGWIIRAVSMAE